MRDLDIAEVARRSGLPASTLRYYEEQGLIASSGRRGLRRLFDPGVLERLALIRLGRVAGFPLAEIASMLSPAGPGAGGAVDRRPAIDRQRLAARADALDLTIRQLGALSDGLRHAAACPADDHLDCPTFQRLLRAAASGALRAPGDRSGGRSGGRSGSRPSRAPAA